MSITCFVETFVINRYVFSTFYSSNLVKFHEDYSMQLVKVVNLFTLLLLSN